MSTFQELGLRPEILQAVDELGFETPSKIQTLAVPAVLSGKDIVGLSATYLLQENFAFKSVKRYLGSLNL